MIRSALVETELNERKGEDRDKGWETQEKDQAEIGDQGADRDFVVRDQDNTDQQRASIGNREATSGDSGPEYVPGERLRRDRLVAFSTKFRFSCDSWAVVLMTSIPLIAS